jgi:DNA polymerase-3 subunit epsilon
MKCLYLDVETTGRDPRVHGIHQIATIMVTPYLTKTFSMRVQPRAGCEIEDNALKVSGTNREDLATFPTLEEVCGRFRFLLANLCNQYDREDKFYLIGFNNRQFDNEFFRQFWCDGGGDEREYGSLIWANTLDVYVLATQALISRRHAMKDFKLVSVAREFGIDVDESRLHDALYDVELTKSIYEAITVPAGWKPEARELGVAA